MYFHWQATASGSCRCAAATLFTTQIDVIEKPFPSESRFRKFDVFLNCAYIGCVRGCITAAASEVEGPRAAPRVIVKERRSRAGAAARRRLGFG